MKNNIKILFAFFALSGVIHILFFSLTNLTFTSKPKLEIHAWPNILKKKELSANSQTPNIPKEISYSTDKIRKSYFSRSLNSASHKYKFDEKIDKYSESESVPAKYRKENKNIFFLWKKEPGLNKKKAVSYRALVSPYGRVILLYPEKLTLDSHKNIFNYNRLKESVYFAKSKFFWTKLNLLVK
ncbi:MAG: hypothetical protein K9L95_01345 [Candidatus Omnitrophica bacterium]|nr:hypothetical protein [Candidatus Omnitrophota bacterium]MCF7876805.1 hypothetical protein [Candidatus Omnitrophota bacterium]MCF7878100.1 hypothetical protein [Candidatus Omnitrophota bacterium]MCF7893248.1 hypothetical protein [Candidatus Omnitrophota bacterium]